MEALSGEQLLGKCQRLKTLLGEMGLHYGNQSNFSMRVSPDVFYLTLLEFNILEQRGETYLEWLRVVNELYQESLHNPQLSWIQQLFDQHLDPSLVSYQRNSGALKKLPFLFRTDQSTLTDTCEVQVPMSLAAWGFCHGIQQAMQKIFPLQSNEQSIGRLDKGFMQAMRLATQKDDPVVFLPLPAKQDYLATHQFFANSHHVESGKIISGKFQDLEIKNDGMFFRTPEGYFKIDVIYPSSRHRCHALAGKIFQKAAEHDVVIEPALNLLFDQKTAMALPFHSQTRERFSDQVRELFPETYLVARHWYPVINREEMSWAELVKLSRKQRTYVLKYAGIDPQRKSGGTAVFRLSDFNKEGIVQVIEQALADFDQGHPWIIQPLVREQYTLRYWDEDTNSLLSQAMYFRLSPFYMKLPREATCIIGFGATLSSFWKVSGRWDSVLTEVRLLKVDKFPKIEPVT